MPVTPTYPGVYVEELPSGVHTITGVATSITAFVGYTAQGPVDKAIQITNFGDYERTFGGLDRDSEISYAVQQFYLNGGSNAYVVRVARNVASASVTLLHSVNPPDATTEAALIVTAANPGAWGNNVRLDVDYDTTNPDSSFNLTVRRYDLQAGKLVATQVEQFRNLSMNSGSSLYAVSVINSGSKLVGVERFGAITFDPAKRGWSLSGDLTPMAALGTGDTTITGILDGRDAFTLTINPAGVNAIGGLLTQIQTAITNAGLGGGTPRLTVGRADGSGADNVAGDFIKLVSQQRDNTDPGQDAEASSVEITSAPSKTRLGLANGGREKDAASLTRPWPTGTFSGNQSLILSTAITGAIDYSIDDRSTSPATPVASGTLTLPVAGVAVSDLAGALQTLFAQQSAPEAQGAVVERFGPFLRVVPGGDSPNLAVTLTNGGGGSTAATDALLTSAAGAFVGPRSYALGPGGLFGAETTGASGSDGIAPTAVDILGDYLGKTGLYALRDVDLFNLLVIPRTTDLTENEADTIIQAAESFCEQRRAFLIVDPHRSKDRTSIGAWIANLGSRNAAVYYPRIRVADPLAGFRIRTMAASGALAGVFARTDAARGVWKAPAGIDAGIRGLAELDDTLTDEENGQLNPLGVNVIRTFPVYGTVVWGARTLDGDDRKASEWKYIPIRRLALMLEESLYRGTKWVVFEPNDEPLWAQIRLNIGAFMHGLFRQGAFQGRSAREAYFVKCDAETTTQNDRDLGVVNILVGFAPLKPAEFVILQIQQIAGQIET